MVLRFVFDIRFVWFVYQIRACIPANADDDHKSERQVTADTWTP